MSSKPVIIVGGGIGGMAAAVALSRIGLPSLVMERASELGEIGAGVQLGPNAFRALDILGVLDQVSANAVFVEDFVMMDAVSSEPVFRLEFGEEFRGRFRYPYAVVHRADLHRALLQACEASDAVAFATSATVTDVRQTGDDVYVATAGGEEVAGCAVIGADGLWSCVRQRIVGDGRPRVSGHVAYRAVVPADTVPQDMRWNSSSIWVGPRTHFVHYHLRGGDLYNIVATFHSDQYVEGWNERGDRDEILVAFADFPAGPKSVLELPTDWRRWVLCDRDPIERWSEGRIALLGDAAHPMLQYYAQGAAMALEDAICLAAEIERAACDFETAFQAYQHSRFMRTGRVQLTARFIGDWIFHASGVQRLLRNEMLGARTRQQFYDGFRWLYGYELPQLNGAADGGARMRR
jgi:3-hydroxybenzoate 6-monooxygenase